MRKKEAVEGGIKKEEKNVGPMLSIEVAMTGKSTVGGRI